MDQQSNLTPFKFAYRGMLGGMVVPAFIGLVLVMGPPREPTYGNLVSSDVPPILIYSGIIGAIIGFVIGMLYQNDLTPGVLQRLTISTGLAALLPALPLIALREGDWLGTGLIILTLMIVSGIMPAITTTRRKSRNIRKEL